MSTFKGVSMYKIIDNLTIDEHDKLLALYHETVDDWFVDIVRDERKLDEDGRPTDRYFVEFAVSVPLREDRTFSNVCKDAEHLFNTHLKDFGL